MSGRWWALSRRQTIVALAIAVLVGVVLALVLPRSHDSASNPEGSHALWAFGFSTVRIDPQTLTPSRHPFAAGLRLSASPRQARRGLRSNRPTGESAFPDGSANTLKVIGRLPPGAAKPATADPSIAKASDSLWLVTKPGTLVRFDLPERRATGTVELSPAVNQLR